MPAENTNAPIYPLKFDPIYKPKVWGGRSLERLGRDLPQGEMIGESWELVDLATTSASGGGGGAEHSVIANGPLAGKTFAEVIADYGADVLGNLKLNEFNQFPLLVKFLDANQNLSVQVHPSPEYAEQHDDAFLKSEAWYIVDCAPGSVIYKGVQEGVTPAQLREAIEQNTDEAVVPLLVTVPVKPGDCHYLPSGTCHALGAGILVAEVQTPSDTTFRVYDWGRTGRELHVEQALQCIEFGPAQSQPFEFGQTTDVKQGAKTKLVECEYFRIERMTITTAFECDFAPRQPEVWMCLTDCGTAERDGQTLSLRAGDTIYFPPGMPAWHFKTPADATYLEVTFPQARSEAVA